MKNDITNLEVQNAENDGDGLSNSSGTTTLLIVNGNSFLTKIVDE